MNTASTSLSPRAARAHAVKNCLAVVFAINQLLEREVDERSKRRLARSQDAVERMLALIQEDLGPDHGPDADQFQFVPAEDVLRAVAARVEDRAEAGRVELVFQAGRGGVLGDGPELTEALVNIVLNAIEATPAGGVVSVVTQCPSDGSQVWSVRDTGPGIPEDVRNRLGMPFVTGRAGGSGVGLAVARRTFQRHGGQLHVRSIQGSDTLISIRMPGIESVME
jgi:signal transduction histidine kinase